jgi:hypothetical protein
VTRDGCVVLCEVVSSSQTMRSQLNKLQTMSGAVTTGTGAAVSIVAQGLNHTLKKGTSGLLGTLSSLVKRK